MWMAHHWPSDYDRCARLGSRHVCRRCAVLYPAAAVVTVGGLAWGATAAWVPWVMLLAPVPTVVEWCAEHVRGVPHHPRRLVAGTLVAAPALGLGFARYLRDQGDPWFWVMSIGWSLVCLAAAFAGRSVAPDAPAAARLTTQNGGEGEPGSAGPGDPAQVEGVAEQVVRRHHPDGDAGPPGHGERQIGLEPEVPVTVGRDR